MIRIPWSTQPPVGTPLDFSHPLCQGLVGCWPMNEGAGAKLVDLTLGATNTIANGVWSNIPLNGKALYFNGTNTSVTTKHVPAGGSLTVSFKIYIPDTTNFGTTTYKGLVCQRNTISTDQSFDAHIYDSKIRFLGWRADSVGATAFVLSAPSNLQVQTAYHVCCKYGSGAVSIFINGVSVATTTYTGNIFNNAVSTVFGDVVANAARYYKGYMSEVLIYNRALSAQEIKSLYENPYQIYQPLTYFIDPLTGLNMYVDIDGTVKQVQAAYGLVDGVVKQMNPYTNVGGIVKQL